MRHLTIDEHDAGDWHVLRLEGYVDANTLGSFEAKLSQLIEQGHHKLKLDFDKLAYLSSAGVGLLMATHREVQRQGGNLAIINASNKTRHTLLLLGFSRLNDEGSAEIAIKEP
jgi:anti-sigma B factor antagonist